MELRPNTTGHGFIYITLAKIYFLLTATFVSLTFPRLFDNPILYGQYRVITGILNIVTMVVIIATLQTVSRLVSENETSITKIQNKCVIVNSMVFGPIFLTLFIGADWIVDAIFSDHALGAPLRVGSIVIATYIPYAVIVGSLNGARLFFRQAFLDVAFSTLKTTFMTTLLVLSSSVTLVFGGFALASTLVFFLSLVIGRPKPMSTEPEPTTTPSLRTILYYLLPLSAYAFLLNCLLQIDVIALKVNINYSTLSDIFTMADTASASAGIYGAIKNLSIIPYQGVIALTLVVFPIIARLSSSESLPNAGNTIKGALRFAVIISSMSIAILGSAPEDLVKLLFGEKYISGALVLPILLMSMGCLAVLYTCNAILTSLGKPGLSTISGLISVASQLVLLLFHPFQVSDHLSSALATLFGTFIGMSFSLYFIRRYSNGWGYTLFMSFPCTYIALFVGWSLEFHWIFRILISFLILLVMLCVARAVTLSDLYSVMRTFNRKDHGH